MCERDLILGTIAVLYHKRQVLAWREGLKTEDIHAVIRANLVVVFRVCKRERKHALLLQVRLVDMSKGPDNDCQTTEVTRLKGSVLTRGTFTVVAVTDDNPLDALGLVLRSDLRDTAELARELVLDLVSLAVLSVNRTDEAVLRDVLKMSTVLEPGSTGGDVVGC